GAAHDRETVFKGFGYVGGACRMLGQTAEAIAAYQQALDGARQAKDEKRQALYAYWIGNLYIGFADTSQALAYLEEARQLYRQVRDTAQESWSLLRIGEAYDR